MKKILCFLMLFSCSHTFARPLVDKKSTANHSFTPNQKLAQQIFSQFLKCPSKTEDDLINCIKPMFSDDLGQNRVRSYSQLFYITSKVSEPFVCDSKTQESIKNFENTAFDIYLCFNSDLRGKDSTKPGIVFFKIEKNGAKISKLKL